MRLRRRGFAVAAKSCSAVNRLCQLRRKSGLTDRSAKFGCRDSSPRTAELFMLCLHRCRSSISRNSIAVFIRRETVSVRARLHGETDRIFFRATDAVELWSSASKKANRLESPCGLGARHLRLEMCYPLIGSDLSPETNPIGAGLGFFVDLTKRNFIGGRLVEDKKKTERRKARRIPDERERPPPRPHYAFFPKLGSDRRTTERHAFSA